MTEIDYNYNTQYYTMFSKYSNKINIKNFLLLVAVTTILIFFSVNKFKPQRIGLLLNRYFIWC